MIIDTIFMFITLLSIIKISEWQHLLIKYR